MKIQLSGSKIEICSLGVVTVPKIRHSGSVGVAVQPRCGSSLVTRVTQLLTWISQVQMQSVLAISHRTHSVRETFPSLMPRPLPSFIAYSMDDFVNDRGVERLVEGLDCA